MNFEENHKFFQCPDLRCYKLFNNIIKNIPIRNWYNFKFSIIWFPRKCYTILFRISSYFIPFIYFIVFSKNLMDFLFIKIWWISFSYLFIWNDAHKKSYMKWQFFFEGIVSISESFNFFQSIFRFVRKYSDLFNYIWMTFNFLSNLSITHF